MRLHFLSALALVAVLLVAIAAIGVGAGAAAANETDDDDLDGEADDQDDACEEPEHVVDSQTVICETDYGDGVVELLVFSEIDQSMEITDAGAFMTGGPRPWTRAHLREGELRQVSWGITEYQGAAGISVFTDHGPRHGYDIPLEEETRLLPYPPRVEDVQMAGLGGFAIVAIMFSIKLLLRQRGHGVEEERVL